MKRIILLFALLVITLLNCSCSNYQTSIHAETTTTTKTPVQSFTTTTSKTTKSTTSTSITNTIPTTNSKTTTTTIQATKKTRKSTTRNTSTRKTRKKTQKKTTPIRTEMLVSYDESSIIVTNTSSATHSLQNDSTQTTNTTKDLEKELFLKMYYTEEKKLQSILTVQKQPIQKEIDALTKEIDTNAAECAIECAKLRRQGVSQNTIDIFKFSYEQKNRSLYNRIEELEEELRVLGSEFNIPVSDVLFEISITYNMPYEEAHEKYKKYINDRYVG